MSFYYKIIHSVFTASSFWAREASVMEEQDGHRALNTGGGAGSVSSDVEMLRSWWHSRLRAQEGQLQG